MKLSEVKSTEETIELIKVYAWLFAVVVVMLVFGFTVFSMLYSVIFITQPIKTMAPIYGYSNNHGFKSNTHNIPGQAFGAMPVWQNPELDESWTPGPPPDTPPDHLEDDHEREQLAQARKEAE
jgi:hypothetical protein